MIKKIRKILNANIEVARRSEKNVGNAKKLKNEKFTKYMSEKK